MANEKHDPWALLREARNSVALEVAVVEAFKVSDADKRVLDLLARIDAALAEPLDSATPVVESEVKWHRTLKGSTFFVAHLNDADMALRVEWDRWYWKVTREGHTNTLDEAKSAAIAAARGLK